MLSLMFFSAALAAAPTWRETLDSAVPAVVSLRVSGTRSFDTETASSSSGTGFVVDAERGILLTNRHMVHSGPVVAEAVFLDNEEVPLKAIYRDPVHDFGFYQFDPADLRYMELAELELHPESAEVGIEVRVIGNNAGEKISILDSTLARLDRDAPRYGGNTYNDFNTFYFQAASGTSGGSSGSPVINQDGQVVALNAGGASRAASSFYLPLDRVVRALELIQDGQPVSRGTLEAVFQNASYDELGRLGLSEDSEAAHRAAFPDATGMLVVKEVVPGGPAQDKLHPGDILLGANGDPLPDFVSLEALLDSHVGQALPLRVERDGQQQLLELTVQDLHAITPDRYLEFGGAVLNTVSYQQARNHGVPAQGVYVASRGWVLRRAGVPDGAVITALNGEEISDLAAFERIAAALPDGARVPLRYHAITNPRHEQVAVLVVDRLWNPMQLCVRDAVGAWPCTPSAAPPAAQPPSPQTVSLGAEGPKAVQALAPSLLMVEVNLPLRTEGSSGASFRGAGLVLDTEAGLVLADRDTLPVGLGDVTLVVGGELRIPATVAFIHPEHNFAILRYDPALVGDTPLQAAELRPAPLAPGDRTWLVGLTSGYQVIGRPTSVSRVDPIKLPLPNPPGFRESNLEIVSTSEVISSVGGVLCDRQGRVSALWASFAWQTNEGRQSRFAGMPIEAVLQVLPTLQAGQPVELRTLGAELSPVSLADARDRGLSQERAQALADHDPKRRQALYVLRVSAAAPAHELLQGGDLLLAINGQPVTRFHEVEAAAQTEALELLVLRNGQELALDLPTAQLPTQGISELMLWSGVLLHNPHHELASQRGLPPEGVYVAWYWYGSPAHRYKLTPTWRITAVGPTPTPDLAAFQAAVADLQHGDAVKLTVVDLDGKEQVRTLKLDLEYWPSRSFAQGEAGWTQVD